MLSVGSLTIWNSPFAKPDCGSLQGIKILFGLCFGSVSQHNVGVLHMLISPVEASSSTTLAMLMLLLRSQRPSIYVFTKSQSATECR